MDGIFKKILVIWAIGLVLSLGLLAGLIYVAVHFISKVW